MRRMVTTACLGLIAALAAGPAAAQLPPGCQQQITDYGDAPECILAYPGVIGNFPTCSGTCGPAGTQQADCAPLSSPPGAAAGFVEHFLPFGFTHFWLGCYTPAAPSGVDSEPDGKTNTPAAGFSACLPGIPTDCVEVAPWGQTFDQDECYTDGVDAGITAPIVFSACAPNVVSYNVANCSSTPANAVLNILVDWNQDGDWNDNFACASGCAYEWGVKNFPISIPPGCTALSSPPFLSGPFPGNGWLRITITQTPVDRKSVV